jgi:predicted aconitase with swiveling domain
MPTIKCRGVVKGKVEAEALVCKNAFSFLGDVDMDTGIIIAKGHEHEGKSIAGKILIYPETKGSSGGCVVLTVLAKQNKQPAAIVLEKPADPNIVEGAIISGVILVAEPQNPISTIPNGSTIIVDANEGVIIY